MTMLQVSFLFASWELCNAAAGFSIDKGKYLDSYLHTLTDLRILCVSLTMMHEHKGIDIYTYVSGISIDSSREWAHCDRQLCSLCFLGNRVLLCSKLCWQNVPRPTREDALVQPHNYTPTNYTCDQHIMCGMQQNKNSEFIIQEYIYKSTFM